MSVASVSLNFGEVASEEVARAVLRGSVDARHSPIELLRAVWLRGTLLAGFLSDRLATSRDGYLHRNVLPGFRKKLLFFFLLLLFLKLNVGVRS